MGEGRRPEPACEPGPPRTLANVVLDRAEDDRSEARPEPPPVPEPSPPPPEPAPPLPEPPPRRRRWRRRLLLALAVLLLGYAAWEALTWPDVAALAEANPETTAFIERYRERHGSSPAWSWVRYGRISDQLKHAVVVAEDIDFFSHDGFAWNEIEQAFRDARERRELPRGASTLTQQLAKNLWLSPSRNPWRKVKEAILTAQLERHLPKRRILELYLNVAEFGPGIYGAEAAARHYFGKPATALGPREAAALAAGLPRPSTWHPGSASRTYQNRVNRIAGRVAKTAWVQREL